MAVPLTFPDDRRVRKIAQQLSRDMSRDESRNPWCDSHETVTAIVARWVTKLWANGLSHHPSGELGDWDEDDIRHYSNCSVEAELWAQLLMENDILERLDAENCYAFVDRDELTRLDKKKSQDRIRQARRRARQKSRDGHVTVTPDMTGHDRTEKTEESDEQKSRDGHVTHEQENSASAASATASDVSRTIDVQELQRRVANEWHFDVSLGGQAKRAQDLAPFSEDELAYAKAKTDADGVAFAKVKALLDIVARYRRESAEANAAPKVSAQDLADIEAENFRTITDIVNTTDSWGVIVERREVARHIAAGMTPDAIKAMYAPQEAACV